MRWLFGALLGLVVIGSLATAADARPGGGHSYSGGGRSSGGSYRSSSSSSSSSGGGGGGDATSLAVLTGLIFGSITIIAIVRNRKPTSWTSQTTPPSTRTDFAPLVQRDPAFSQAAFEDFAFQLYARTHRARGKPTELAALTPYLAADLLAGYATAAPVSSVVIGSLRVIGVTATDAGTSVDVRIEANLAGTAGTTSVIERWTFTRAAGVLTRALDRTRTFPCPQCNAPFTPGASPRTCAHCAADLAPGKHDWTVTAASVGASNSVGLTLTGTVAEVGNDLITIVEADAYPAMQALYEADKNVTWDTFETRVKMIYGRLNSAWNAQDLAPVRGLVSASLLGYLGFWIDEYKRQRLANRLEDAKVHRLALAKVMRDPFFDAVTVRVFADGNDFTVDASGKVVGGSKTDRRMYTEYWTLIRSSARRGPVTTEPKCPNCGAPLAISDAGACTHCNAEIENGSFDWVLSKIEQDEVYTG